FLEFDESHASLCHIQYPDTDCYRAVISCASISAETVRNHSVDHSRTLFNRQRHCSDHLVLDARSAAWLWKYGAAGHRGREDSIFQRSTSRAAHDRGCQYLATYGPGDDLILYRYSDDPSRYL